METHTRTAPLTIKTTPCSNMPEDDIQSTAAEASGIVVKEPLRATFVVCAYNQEKYIREAVEGALSQTYSPLEVILSDDCSTDSTFDIMQAMARNYKGPHSIRLNRNNENLGVCQHVNRTFELMTGIIWIGAAGDDISMPKRTLEVIKYFEADARIMCVTSGAQLFGSKEGVLIPWALNRKLKLVEICALNLGQQGSTSAYHRDVFAKFPPLAPTAKAEDYALTFRACLLGVRYACAEILVKYRSHENNLANSPKINIVSQRRLKLSLSSMHQALHDLDHFAEINQIDCRVPRMLLEARIYAHERQANAAEMDRSTDIIAVCIHRLLDAFKICRLLHIKSWIEGRILASYINKVSRRGIKEATKDIHRGSAMYQ